VLRDALVRWDGDGSWSADLGARHFAGSAGSGYVDGTQRQKDPYLLWIGGALTVVGCVLGIIGLIWRNSDDNVRTPRHDDRHLNP